MRWFRVHAEAVDSRKLQRLKPEVFKFWFNLCCVSCHHDGALPDIETIGWKLRIDPDRVRSMMDTLVAENFIDTAGDGFKMHDWEDWQYQGNTSTSRVRKYRDAVKSAGRTVNGYLKFRDEVFERDSRQCVYCGSGERLCIDHVVPVSLGGDDEIDNLATACKECNSGKAGRTPDMAGYKIVADCAYETVYHTNLSRFSLNSETVTQCDSTQNATVPSSVSVSVSGKEGSGEKTWGPKTSETFFREKFWPIVWRKIGPDAARTSWLRKVTSLEMAERVVAVAIAQGPGILERGRRPGAAILHPTTWLNQGRYDDEQEPNLFMEVAGALTEEQIQAQLRKGRTTPEMVR